MEWLWPWLWPWDRGFGLEWSGLVNITASNPIHSFTQHNKSFNRATSVTINDYVQLNVGTLLL